MANAKQFRSLPLDERQQKARAMLSRYENRVPVVLERYRSSHLPDIEQKKFLIPNDLTVRQFQEIVKRRIRLHAQETIFLFVEKRKKDALMLLPSDTMGSVYSTHRDEDGFLYIIYSDMEWSG